MEYQTKDTLKTIIAAGLIAAGMTGLARAQDDADAILDSDKPLVTAPLEQSLALLVPFAAELERLTADQIGAEWTYDPRSYEFLANTSPGRVQENWNELREDPDFQKWWQSGSTQQVFEQLHGVGVAANSTIGYMTPDQIREAFLATRLANEKSDLKDAIEQYSNNPSAQFCIFWFTCGFKPTPPKPRPGQPKLRPLIVPN